MAQPASRTDHALFALEKIGHPQLSDAITQLRRVLAEHGYSAETTVTIKPDTLAVRLVLKPVDPENPDQPSLIP